jgi:hypothetical protein
MTHLSRRDLLSALGAAGLATVAGTRLSGAGDRPFARYTVAQATEGEGSLRVSWYETYNGSAADAPGGSPTANASTTLDPTVGPAYVADAPGAVVSVGNVLPGDEGRLTVGLQALDADLNVWFRPTITTDAENGQNEPERAAEGVDTDDVGELGEAVEAAYWLDNSVVFGACDGRDDPFEPTLRTAGGDPASGSFVGVADALAGGVRLPFDGAEGCPDALPADGNRCLGLRWTVPDAVGNEIQGDSLTFALEFVATACGDEVNPFGEVAE